MTNDTLDKIRQKTQLQVMRDYVVCTFYQDNKVCSVCVNIKENEQIGICFEKGYVIVRTQTEVKFVCKGKAFISLWR